MNLQSRPLRRLLIASLATTVFLAACGGSDDSASDGADVEEPASTDPAESPESSETPESSASTAPTTAESEPVSDDAFDPDGVLRYIYNNSPGTLDPHIVNTAFANVPLFLIFDRLVHVSPEGEAIPGLATSWEFAEDGSTLTFNLREGVTFHDGTPFDAEAVKVNIDHAQNAEGSFVTSELTAIDSVDVIDPLTVVFNLNVPDVGLILKLSDRAGAMMSPASIEAGDAAERPVGAGMMEIDGEYQVGVQLNFKRYDDYWDPSVQKLAGLEMTFLTDTTAALNSVRSGGADAALIREAEIDPAEDAGLNVLYDFDLGFANVNLNPANAPALADQDVRLALNLAIDRQAIVDGLLFGYGKVTNQPFPSGYFAHDPDAPLYDYDPEEARRLLSEAGYADGFDLEITSVPTPASVRVAEALASQLTDIGVNATVVQVEAAVLGQMITVDQTTQVVSLRWTGRPDPTSTIEQLYMPGGSQNPGDLVTDRAFELYEAQKVETDPTARAELLQQLGAEFVENPPATQLVLFETVSATAATNEVVGLQNWVTGKLEFRGVGMAR